MVEENKELATKKDSVTIPKKYLVIGIIVVVAIVGIIIGQWTAKIIETKPVSQKQSCPFECCVNDPNYDNRVCQGSNYQCINNKCMKTNCPYECCLESEFSAKSCPTDYECQNNKCVAIDSDKDGLTDIEERQFGSNPFVFDTDGDGLSDYVEKQKGTDPNNQNTDGDRYNDNIDSNPTVKNSASVDVKLTNKEWDWDVLGILDIFKGDLNVRIATAKADISIQNSGNDYTEYVRFDIVFKLINSEVKRVPESIGRLNVGETQNKHYEYELKLGDIPNTLYNAITQKSTQWDIQIQNIKYEKF